MATGFTQSSRVITRALEKQPHSTAGAQVTHHTLLSNLPVTDTSQIKGDKTCSSAQGVGVINILVCMIYKQIML